MKTTDFKLGQVLCYVERRRWRASNEAQEHVVKAVGRKWVTAGLVGLTSADQRFDPETMEADGGDFRSPGRYYMSHEEYAQFCEGEVAWRELSDWILMRNRPKRLGAAVIRAALKALQEHANGEALKAPALPLTTHERES